MVYPSPLSNASKPAPLLSVHSAEDNRRRSSPYGAPDEPTRILVPNDPLGGQKIVRHPLTNENLMGAMRLVDRIYSRESGQFRPAAQTLEQAVHQETFHEPEDGRFAQRYTGWIVCCEQSRKVIGHMGLYRYVDDPEAEWLGWLCVDPDYRRQGIGKNLLHHAVQKASLTGRPFLRLFTEDMPFERAAQAFCEKQGLKVVRTRPFQREFQRMYWELGLHPPKTRVASRG